jgi:hypothetical protein
MSVRVMSMIFERYPNGGGEMLLALALADHAHDDGTHIHPGIKLLAFKTRQSERAVQYQLRRMEESGWLILKNSGNGGRNQRREYQIHSGWLKGEEIAPLEIAVEMLKGATDDTKGCKSEHERVQLATLKGAKLLHPHITISEPPIEPSLEPRPQSNPRASTANALPPTHRLNGNFSMFIDWAPQLHFDDLLTMFGLPGHDFGEDLPEFVTYWLGQSESLSQGSWEHKFIRAIKRNVESRARAGNDPQPIPARWMPEDDTINGLLRSGVTQRDIDSALLSFRAFWRDDGTAMRSWNGEFIKQVQFRAASQGPTCANALDTLTDRSWAERGDTGFETFSERAMRA